MSINNCINVVVRYGLVYCTGRKCGIYVGLCDETDEGKIVTCTNVWEVLSKPHTSYSHFSTERGTLQVIFTERVEIGENSSNGTLDVSNVLVHALKNDSNDQNVDMPSTSASSKNPTIRVADSAS